MLLVRLVLLVLGRGRRGVRLLLLVTRQLSCKLLHQSLRLLLLGLHLLLALLLLLMLQLTQPLLGHGHALHVVRVVRLLGGYHLVVAGHVGHSLRRRGHVASHALMHPATKKTKQTTKNMKDVKHLPNYETFITWESTAGISVLITNYIRNTTLR